MAQQTIPSAIRERVEKLRQTIDHHRYLYHVLDKQEISEQALDSLKDELVKLEYEYPELITTDSPTQRVAGVPLKEFKKISHKVAQWSFNDAFTEEDIRDFDAKVRRQLKTILNKDVLPTYTCELKIDGLKIVFEYKKGVLQTAATRGNGKIGEDVTHNIRTIESVPLRLRRNIDIIAEGEVWMGKKNFEKLNKERQKKGEQVFANPRNSAAGTIRQLDPSIVSDRKLSVFVYDVAMTEEIVPNTQHEELQYLRELGFKVNNHFKVCTSVENVIAYWKYWTNHKEKEDYWIDGVVLKVDERPFQEALGYTGKAPRFGIAFKFPAEQVTTIVEDIQLQVGRTGILTPVAHLKPVSVAGSTVSRATLHNEDEIKRLDVRVGDTVIIQKAGDVIPDIISVVKELRTGKEKKYVFPKRVEACGGDGKIERIPGQAAWRCVSTDSYAQQKRKLYYFAGKSAFDIEGLGPRNVDVLLDNKLISNPADFFTLKKGDLLNLPRFAEKSVDKLLASIEKGRRVSLARFIISLSINHVGEETAYLLADHFKTLNSIEKSSIIELTSIEGIGEIMANSIYEWFNAKKNQEIVKKLTEQVTIEKEQHEAPTQGLLTGKSVVLTGTLESMGRDEAKEKIRQLGGHVSNAVSAATDLVIAGENAGSKEEKAREYRVKIINEQEFLKMIK